MAVDMFINLQGIKGEAQDGTQGPKGDCDVLAWSWGLSQTGTTHMGSGGGAGKVNVQDVSFTKYVDSASPALKIHLATGKHIPKVVLLCRKAGGEQKKYIEITMEDCIITSLSTGGSHGEERLTENVTINFAKVAYEYFAQTADGNTKSAGVFKYHISANKQF
jgi:type VI secretion system secreted protein Hcp